MSREIKIIKDSEKEEIFNMAKKISRALSKIVTASKKNEINNTIYRQYASSVRELYDYYQDLLIGKRKF